MDQDLNDGNGVDQNAHEESVANQDPWDLTDEELDVVQASQPSLLLTTPNDLQQRVFFAAGELTMSLETALKRGQITCGPGTTFTVNGATIELTEQLGSGAIVTMIGNVKAG